MIEFQCPRTHVTFTKKRIRRFFSKIDYSNGPDSCWIWQAATNKAGYGVIGFQESWQGHAQQFKAHRVMFMIVNKYIPNEILHDCHVRQCVNPRHLKDGTHKENMHEVIENGTHNMVTATGKLRAKYRRLGNATI